MSQTVEVSVTDAIALQMFAAHRDQVNDLRAFDAEAADARETFIAQQRSALQDLVDQYAAAGGDVDALHPYLKDILK